MKQQEIYSAGYSPKPDECCVFLGNDGFWHSQGVAFDKYKVLEQCANIKKCNNCTALNVTRNRKCFHCGKKLENII